MKRLRLPHVPSSTPWHFPVIQDSLSETRQETRQELGLRLPKPIASSTPYQSENARVGICKDLLRRSRNTSASGNQKLPGWGGGAEHPGNTLRTDSKGKGAREAPFAEPPQRRPGSGPGQPCRLAGAGERHAVLFKSSTFFAISPLAGWGYPPHRGRC